MQRVWAQPQHEKKVSQKSLSLSTFSEKFLTGDRLMHLHSKRAGVQLYFFLSDFFFFGDVKNKYQTKIMIPNLFATQETFLLIFPLLE